MGTITIMLCFGVILSFGVGEEREINPIQLI